MMDPLLEMLNVVRFYVGVIIPPLHIIITTNIAAAAGLAWATRPASLGIAWCVAGLSFATSVTEHGIMVIRVGRLIYTATFITSVARFAGIKRSPRARKIADPICLVSL